MGFEQVDVPEDDPTLLVERGFRSGVPFPEERVLFEDPWGTQCAAADHHAVAARDPHQFRHVFRLGHVTIADDRDRTNAATTSRSPPNRPFR